MTAIQQLGIGLLLLVIAWLIRMFGPNFGIDYSPEIHTALFTTFVLFWIYFLIRALRATSDSSIWWVGYALFSAASIYTDFYVGFTLAVAQLLTLVYLLNNFNGDILKRWVLANTVILLMFWGIAFSYDYDDQTPKTAAVQQTLE